MATCDFCGQRTTSIDSICGDCREDPRTHNRLGICVVPDCGQSWEKRSPYCARHAAIGDVVKRVRQSKHASVRLCAQAVKQTLVDGVTPMHSGRLGKVDNTGGLPADITCRSLIISSGGQMPSEHDVKATYMQIFGFDNNSLCGMSGNSLLDIGCGASFFCAELAALYKVNAKGIDIMSADQFDAARNECIPRYVTSVYVAYGEIELKSTYLDGETQKIVRLVAENMDVVIDKYTGSWLQTGTDIFDAESLPKMVKICVSSNMLGYFDGDKQSRAIENILSVARSQAYLASSVTLFDLTYKWNELKGWNVDRSGPKLAILKRSFLSKIGTRL